MERILLSIFVLLYAFTMQNAVARDFPIVSKCEKPDGIHYPIIDFHTHTFNFRHLPLKGILYSWAVPEIVADAAAEYFWSLTGDYGDVRTSVLGSPLPLYKEDEWMDRMTKDEKIQPQKVVDGLNEAEWAEVNNSLNQYLVQLARYEEEQQHVMEAEEPGPLYQYFNSFSRYFFQSDFSRQPTAEDFNRFSLSTRFLSLLIYPLHLFMQSEGIFHFFHILTQPENKLVEALLNEYCEVDYFVHHMMDLAPVYSSGTPVSFRKQLDLAQEMRKLFNDRLVTFSAFVPFRYDEYDFPLMKYSMKTGAVGMKYYPPSGYSMRVKKLPPVPPATRFVFFDNSHAIKQWESRYLPLDDPQLQKNWRVPNIPRSAPDTLTHISREFAGFAADNNLMVFVHHTPEGFEAYPGYGEWFAEPCAWTEALNDLEEKGRKLKLVLGHSGGGGWYEKDDADFYNSFAGQAYNLCVSYENVYCDFGFHDEIFKTKNRKRLHKRLLDLKAKLDQGLVADAKPLDYASCKAGPAEMKYSIFDKLLYGSDWMMVARFAERRKFITGFKAVFTGPLEPYGQNFFSGNAIRLLNIP